MYFIESRFNHYLLNTKFVSRTNIGESQNSESLSMGVACLLLISLPTSLLVSTHDNHATSNLEVLKRIFCCKIDLRYSYNFLNFFFLISNPILEQ